MNCPACSTPANETDLVCVQCGFSLELLDRALGIPPILMPPVADLAGILSARETGQVRTAVESLTQRFPQLSLCVILAHCPQNIPLSIYAFWLFNRGSLFSAVEKGGDNRGILLLIDPAGADAVLMPGYGLEPFVSAAALKACIRLAGTSLNAERSAEAAVLCLAGLENELTAVSQNLPRIFGLHDDQIWSDGSGQIDYAAGTIDESGEDLY